MVGIILGACIIIVLLGIEIHFLKDKLKVESEKSSRCHTDYNKVLGKCRALNYDNEILKANLKDAQRYIPKRGKGGRFTSKK